MEELKPCHIKKIDDDCFIVLTKDFMKEYVDDIVFDSVINYIAAEGDEIRAIKKLTNRLEIKIEKIKKRDSHNQACLRAIHKINRGKDESIAELSKELTPEERKMYGW